MEQRSQNAQVYQLLAVDDDEQVLAAMRRTLSTRGFSTTGFTDPVRALAALTAEGSRFDVATFDVEMPGMSGLELLAAARRDVPDVPCVMVTGDTTANTAVAALRAGAFHYFTKAAMADPDGVAVTLRRAAAYGQLSRRARELESKLARRDATGTMVGASAPMRELFGSIARIAPLDVNVLLRGESGTGKELVARAVHDRSSRRSGAFVAINCAALPDTLVDSELFGHEKGAFTGAVDVRVGAFERAHGGTVFLDEIGDIAPAAQTRLLRVLQEREVQRVGGEVVISVDVRVIAATLVDLEAAVEQHRFRSDLYYRLNVVSLTLPPLRDRIADVPLLVAHFAHKYAAQFDRPVPRFSPGALAELSSYVWPGNVRELENAVQRSIAMCCDSEVGEQWLPDAVRGQGPVTTVGDSGG